jgi:hypothetical protein
MSSSCVYQPFQVSLVFLTVLSASTGDLAPNFACEINDTIKVTITDKRNQLEIKTADVLVLIHEATSYYSSRAMDY